MFFVLSRVWDKEKVIKLVKKKKLNWADTINWPLFNAKHLEYHSAFETIYSGQFKYINSVDKTTIACYTPHWNSATVFITRDLFL